MRHFNCSACQHPWEFEDSTVEAMREQLNCPLCQGRLIETKRPGDSIAGGTPHWLVERILGAPKLDSWPAAIGRLTLLAALLWYSLPFLTEPIRRLPDAMQWMHGVNLIFHEAGHMIFGIFGNHLLMVLGGTFGQLLMPLIIAAAFFIKNRDSFGTACGIWWLGQSTVDCAPYINDARALQLQLLGGGTGKEVHGHDWEFILGDLGLMNQDIYIARGVLLAGRIIMVIGFAWMLAIIARQGLILTQSRG
ncbi:MAG: hypothetical protein AAFX93_03320 [Verrucomicrobiota bacterium]